MERILYLIAVRVDIICARAIISWNILASWWFRWQAWWFRRRARILDQEIQRLDMELAATRQERKQLLQELGMDDDTFDRLLQTVRAAHPQAGNEELARLMMEAIDER